MGRFFSLWDDSRQLAEPCFRVGGPEVGGLTFGNPDSWAPGEDELYIAFFEGLSVRLRHDLFISTMNDESRIAMARLLDPLEVLAVPLEWDDHRFYVLSEEEFEKGEPTTHGTACFSAPAKGLREALSWLWGTQSEFWFPLLGLKPRTNHSLTRWRTARLDQGDARSFLLDQYEGLSFLGCPRELYLTGGKDVVDAATETLVNLEQALSQHNWLEIAREQVLCSEWGTYYHENDPRIAEDKIEGRLLDLAKP